MKKIIIVALVVVLLLIGLGSSVYTVREDQYACVVRFSQIIDTTNEAGLHFKVPFVDSVKYFARATMLYDIPPSAVITSDNPRTEDPMAIIEDILKGVKQEYGEYIVMEDRRAAIRYAMDIAEKDDIIVLAGKGHETYQEINGVKYHLDEREEVAAHLEELRN